MFSNNENDQDQFHWNGVPIYAPHVYYASKHVLVQRVLLPKSLLACTKEEIVEWAKQLKIDYAKAKKRTETVNRIKELEAELVSLKGSR